MGNDKKSLDNFFLYFAFGFAFSSLKVNLYDTTAQEIVSSILLNTMYNFVNGVVTGVGAMIGIDIYNYLKKNSSYDRQNCR